MATHLSRAHVAEYFRRDRRYPFPYYADRRHAWVRFDEFEERHINTARNERWAIKDAVRTLSGLNGPFGVDQVARWGLDCRRFHESIKKSTDAAHIADQKARWRRTIQCIRSMRFNSPVIMPWNTKGFYSEPCTNFLHCDIQDPKNCQVTAAAKTGIELTVVVSHHMTLGYFNGVQRVLERRKANGYWSSIWNPDDIPDVNVSEQAVEARFMFSDPADAIWMRLSLGRYFGDG